MPQGLMPNTLLYGQQKQQDMLQALVEALRQPTGVSLLGQQSAGMGQQSAGSGVSDAMGAMGAQLSNPTLVNGVKGAWNNLSTANTYGTTPFSDQTNILAAQDAVFR